VNESLSEEINIQRGLKKGHSLSPFLFLLVVEGFSGLMRNVMNLNMFKGFRFGLQGMGYSIFNVSMTLFLYGEKQWRICGL